VTISRGVTLTLALALAATAAACSSDDPPRLGSKCDSVFAADATNAEGTCSGADGRIRVTGTDCDSGSDLMLAERVEGEDYAWARVGQEWHLLSPEGTNATAYRECNG
jgi:hypothetical protein